MAENYDGNSSAETQPAKGKRAANTFVSLRHRNFQLYFGGQLVSVAGSWMQIVAQGWLVYEISHSEIALGLVGFAAAIPALLISPWGGVVVDRVPKRNLLVITQSTAMMLAFILSWLTFTGKVQVWHIILLAAGLGVFNAFDGPARQAFVVEMVGREDLPNAIAVNSMMFNSARIIGPALGGLLLAAFGAAWCFFINGLSFLAVIAGLLLMTLPKFEREVKFGSPWLQLRQGLIYVGKQSDLAGLILIALVFSFFGLSYSTLLPAFVDQVLHQGAASYGWINAATGIGAVAGAYFIARGGCFGRQGWWMVLANQVFPFVLALFAYLAWLPASLALAAGMGFGFMIQFTLINTLLQTRVSDAMRGRVMSLYTLTFFGLAPFGNLIIGWAAQNIGLSLTILLSAAITFILSRIILNRYREIVHLP
jgi:MFS family permease